MAYSDSSVMNVPPIFRCCKELALEICWKLRSSQKDDIMIDLNKDIQLSISLTKWTTPLSVIPVIPHNDMDVKLLIHFAKEILYNPVSDIWQPHRLLELSTQETTITTNWSMNLISTSQISHTLLESQLTKLFSPVQQFTKLRLKYWVIEWSWELKPNWVSFTFSLCLSVWLWY